MAVYEVLPGEYDDLDRKLEKELPLSVCGLVHFRLMRRKHLLTEKMVLVDSWPDFSALVILDRQMRDTWLFSVCFCKGPEFASNLEAVFKFAARETPPPPLSFVGCTSDVMDALINLHQSANSCPYRRDYADAIIYTLPAENIIPLTIPNGFKITELSGRHTEDVHKSWPFTNTNEKWTNYQITHFQSVLIETEDGRPVAWEVQHEYGAVGALHVEPEYRRSKLGSVVTRALAEKMTKEGQLVFSLVRETNERSIAFHENNGYVRMPFKFSIMSYLGEAKD